MVSMMKIVTCQNCGIQGKIEGPETADADDQIAKQACPRCGLTQMKRANDYDMGANLSRIEDLLAWVKNHKE